MYIYLIYVAISSGEFDKTMIEMLKHSLRLEINTFK